MPQGIVDGFEAIQIDEHRRRMLPVAVAEREGLGQAIFQNSPVRQSRQGVMVGQMPGTLLSMLSFAYFRLQPCVRGPQLDRALGDRTLQRLARCALGRNVVETPDPILFLDAGIDAPPDGTTQERTTVDTLEAHFADIGLARRGGPVGMAGCGFPFFAIRKQHRGRRPDQGSGGMSGHLFQIAIGALDDAIAHEPNPDCRVLQDQFLLVGKLTDAIARRLVRRYVLEKPYRPLRLVATLHGPARDQTPELTAVCASHAQIQARGRTAG